MDSLLFWKYKLIQFFHDPPGKPYSSWPGTGGHKKVAKGLFEAYTQKELKYYPTRPDWASAGADRPMVALPKTKGISPLQITWRKKPIITHPLSAGFRLDLRPRGVTGEPVADAKVKENVLDEQMTAVEELARQFGEWDNVKDLEEGYYRLWRLYREKLIFRKVLPEDQKLTADHLWAEMPAETRCPDHSIWDHLRVTTALCFLSKKDNNPEEPEAPWLFRFSIGPVQQFIQQSRTSRDLWLSSFLLADLVWHAMLPIVRQYGPDSIIYPDLRGNPRVDVWLAKNYRDSLPDYLENPSTFAAMLPGTFLAVLPRGNKGHLKSIEEMAQAAQDGFRSRWKGLSDMVKSWLERVTDKKDTAWQETWKRQHETPPLYAIWTAIPWMMPEMPIDPENGKERLPNPDAMRQRALPAQRPGFRKHPPELEPDIKALKKRADRLSPWMPLETWARYELAREVYIRTNPGLTTMERGFDYAPTHHQLVVRHALRKQNAPDPISKDSEPGEKCTLCGIRTALGGETGKGNGYLDSARTAARRFWSRKELDPEESGTERLCAICAMKRFLVKAGQDKGKRKISGINKIWAGPLTDFDDVADDDGEVRVPFPSTATISAQKTIESLVSDPAFSNELKNVVEAHRKAGLPRTSFPRSLPRLAAAFKKADPTGREFLKCEAQETLFPNAVKAMADFWKGRGNKKKAEQLEMLFNEVRKLQKALKDKKIELPGTRIAIICLDGDNMGRLITGEADTIEAAWKDVLHPEAVEKIKKNNHMLAAGWLDLLEQKRLTGPSLHAFINRALANFSHRIVPWVVEREFSGRLIYSGGDDVLCIAPADEALFIAARLMQLFSAAWVIDTSYKTDPWEWRRLGWKEEYKQEKARSRFQIPQRPKASEAIRLPVDKNKLEAHIDDQNNWRAPDTKVDGVLLPMLGGGCSLSAGIAYGHFKTPMGTLLGQARHLLDQVAKKQGERACIGLGHFSRNGLKTEFAMPWNYGGERFRGVKSLNETIEGFKDNQIPKRLPYKLREIAPLLSAAAEETCNNNDEWRRLLKGFFENALGKKITKEHFHSAFDLWEQGVKLNKANPEKAVDGLLICRYLAGREDEENEPY
ncbi:MAG: type III-B CRISPR-associated protein Cas10/Cmr2 [Nitrospiraceae bacterium]|nr:type III-B CRISPR-associated protein Cas10/Cmr2 [Nitrospiraceae bacterium]